MTVNCVNCGSAHTSWQGTRDVEWSECRACGHVFVASDEREYYDEADERDPTYNMREEYTWVRDARL